MNIPLTCCVCWDVTTIESKTSCSHFLCQECVSQICTTKCPICRHDPVQNIYITKEILEEIKKRYESQNLSLVNEFTYSNDNMNFHLADSNGNRNLYSRSTVGDMSFIIRGHQIRTINTLPEYSYNSDMLGGSFAEQFHSPHLEIECENVTLSPDIELLSGNETIFLSFNEEDSVTFNRETVGDNLEFKELCHKNLNKQNVNKKRIRTKKLYDKVPKKVEKNQWKQKNKNLKNKQKKF